MSGTEVPVLIKKVNPKQTETIKNYGNVEFGGHNFQLVEYDSYDYIIYESKFYGETGFYIKIYRDNPLVNFPLKNGFGNSTKNEKQKLKQLMPFLFEDDEFKSTQYETNEITFLKTPELILSYLQILTQLKILVELFPKELEQDNTGKIVKSFYINENYELGASFINSTTLKPSQENNLFESVLKKFRILVDLYPILQKYKGLKESNLPQLNIQWIQTLSRNGELRIDFENDEKTKFQRTIFIRKNPDFRISGNPIEIFINLPGPLNEMVKNYFKGFSKGLFGEATSNSNTPYAKMAKDGPESSYINIDTLILEFDKLIKSRKTSTDPTVNQGDYDSLVERNRILEQEKAQLIQTVEQANIKIKTIRDIQDNLTRTVESLTDANDPARKEATTTIKKLDLIKARYEAKIKTCEIQLERCQKDPIGFKDYRFVTKDDRLVIENPSFSEKFSISLFGDKIVLSHSVPNQDFMIEKLGKITYQPLEQLNQTNEQLIQQCNQAIQTLRSEKEQYETNINTLQAQVYTGLQRLINIPQGQDLATTFAQLKQLIDDNANNLSRAKVTIQQLDSTNQQLVQKNNQCTGELTQAQTQIAALNSTISQQNEDLSRANDEIQLLKGANQQLEQKNQSLMQEIARLTQENTTCNTEARLRIQTLEDSNRELVAQIGECNSKLTEAKEKIEELNTINTNLASQRAADLEAAKKEIEKLKQELAAQKDETGNNIAQAIKDLTQKNEELARLSAECTVALGAANRELDQLKEENQQSSAQRDNYKEGLNQATARIQDLEKEKERISEENRLSNEKLQQTSQENEILKNANTELSTRNADYDRAVIEMNTVNTNTQQSLAQRIQEFKNSYDTLSQKVQKSKLKIETLTNMNEGLLQRIEKYDTAIMLIVPNIQPSPENLDQRLTELTSWFKERTEQKEKCDTTLAQNQAQIQTLEAQLLKGLSESKAEIDQLGEQLKACQEKTGQVQATIAECQQQRDALRQQLNEKVLLTCFSSQISKGGIDADLAAQIAAKDGEIAIAKQANETLNQQKQNLEKNINLLQAQILKNEEQYTELQNQKNVLVTQMQEKIQEKDSLIETQKQTIERFTTDLQRLNTQVQSLKSEKDQLILEKQQAASQRETELQEKVNELSSKIAGLEATMKGLENQITSLTEEKDRFSSENVGLKDQVKTISEEKESLSESLAQLQRKNQSLAKEITSLEEEIANCDKERADEKKKYEDYSKEKLEEIQEQKEEIEQVGELLKKQKDEKEKVQIALDQEKAKKEALEKEMEGWSEKIQALALNIEQLRGDQTKTEFTSASLKERKKILKEKQKMLNWIQKKMKKSFNEQIINEQQYNTVIAKIQAASSLLAELLTQINSEIPQVKKEEADCKQQRTLLEKQVQTLQEQIRGNAEISETAKETLQQQLANLTASLESCKRASDTDKIKAKSTIDEIRRQVLAHEEIALKTIGEINELLDQILGLKSV